MIYPLISSDSWQKRYGIQTNGVKCPKCGYCLELNRPFAIKGYRGLEASPCGKCNQETKIFRVVPVDEDKIAVWEGLRG